MIVLPAGSYLMGSPEDEPLRRENEKQRRITFSEPFAMAQTPVTWDQWEASVRDAWCDGVGVEQALTSLPSGERNANFVDQGRGTRPVVGVSWFDAQKWVDDCYEEDLANAPKDGSATRTGIAPTACSVAAPTSAIRICGARRGAPYVATQRGRNYLGFRVSRTLE